MPIIALLQQSVGNVESFLQSALDNGFQAIVIPINSSNMHLESNEQEFIYPDLLLDSTQWNENVVTIISEDLSCDSNDIEIRKRSENILRNELDWSMHLQSNGARLLKLKAEGNFNLARIVVKDLIGHLLVEVPLCNPFAIHALHRNDIDIDRNSKIKTHDTWQRWHDFHTATDYDSKVKVVLTFDEDVVPSKEIVRRWLGEPVDAVIIPMSLFQMRDINNLVLPDKWLELLKHFIRIKANVILSTPYETDNLLLYAKYLKEIFETTLGDHPHKGFEDILNLPQQPLKENLSSNIYEKYELDNVKYRLYQDAIAAALLDCVSEENKNLIVVKVMVLGAGRGPLIRAALNAAEKTKRRIHIYVIEKNINAMRTLRQLKNKLWSNKDIELIHTDLRDYEPPEKVDILISEMLGSFGDNELSPECLNSAERLLKNNGISIPCKYTSYIYPIMSTSLYNQIRLFQCNKFGPYGLQSVYNETAYVVMLQNVFNIGTPKPLFSFLHPNNDKNTERYEILKFKASMDCVLNGIAGCFEATLYKDIKISNNPETHTIGLMSWFGIYFPIKYPMPLKKNDALEIHFWRCLSNSKVWYEWQIVSPQITQVHNRDGHSYPIYLR